MLETIDRGKSVLVHCAAGKDRTGYMVAAYRVERQDWRLEQAVQEMVRYGHNQATHAELQRELRELLSKAR